MLTRTPSPVEPAGRGRRTLALASPLVLLVAGLVAVAPPAAPRAAAVEAGVAETFLVSQTDAAASTDTSLTPDGQHVAYTSTASDLFATDTNGVSDVFIATATQGSDDPFSGSPRLVSAPDAAMPQLPADGPSSLPTVSADGRYVAFISAATNLTSGAHTPGAWTHVFVRDTVLGTTVRLDAGDEPTGTTTSVDISDNGRYVAFVSTAPNLVPGDANGLADGFLADLDTNGDGRLGDVSIRRVGPDAATALGISELVISGNGAHLAFTAHAPLNSGDAPGFTDYLYRGWSADAGITPILVATGAHDPAINGNGEVIVYIADAACGGNDTVIASTRDFIDNYSVALATSRVEFRSGGTIAAPTVSADGSMVAWETTRPPFSLSGIAPILPAPVVRMAAPDWAASTTGGRCDHSAAGDYVDVGTGAAPGLSASGRTIAFSGPSALAPGASAAALAIDTNTHAGLKVSSTLGELIDTGYMTVVDIAQIPVSGLQGYAAALADAPIYRLPIYRLPIYRLPIYRLPIYRLLIEDSPIYRLPIYRLPIYRLDIPGGWPELLAGTPFTGELVQSVTLAEVLEWAAATLADGSDATDAERAAATRIQSLTLSDVDISDSGIDSLSLASILLGGAPLAQIEIPGAGTPMERWQAVVDAQGLGVTVDAQTLLADLDAAGLDVGRSGIEGAVLADLPIDSTLLDSLPMDRLFLTGTELGALDVAALSPTARDALFATDVSGTLADNKGALRPESTVADLAGGTPPEVTFGTLLFSVLDAASYPWEQIAPTSIDPNAALRDSPGYGCDGSKRCGTNTQFSFTFDPGPGESTEFAAPVASVTLPAGTAPSNQYFANASGPSPTWDQQPYAGPIQVDGNLVRLPLPDASGGTSIEFEIWYTSSSQPGTLFSDATLTSGALSATERLYSFFSLENLDDPTNNRVGDAWEDPARPREALQEGRIYYEWISPQYRTLDDEGNRIEGPALDEDYYLVDAPAPGTRLVISTNASDGQIALALFSPSSTGTPLAAAAAGPVPGTAVTEQTGDVSSPAESGGDAAAPLVGHSLVDQAVVSGNGSAEIQAASTDVTEGEQMLLRVTSGNGRPSTSLYSLRARYIDEPTEQVCTPWAAPQTADPGITGTSDPVTATTNTVYLLDTKRFGDTHGASAATQVRDALTSLTGTGHVAGGTVDGAVLSVDADPGVQAARVAADANPCSMEARRALSAAINSYVSQQLGSERAHISSVVLVGGDDIIPLAPVAQHTAQFNEASHAASLRLATLPGGGDCPDEVAEGALDPCATPLSAAAATNFILTDDPYGFADAYESLGGYLYVPTVGVGRLVDSPAQILTAIDRFVDADGLLAADSSVTGGYGAWAELPALVTENLSWRSSPSTALSEPWTKADVESILFPDAGQSPRVVSINTHADETRMLPGVPGAAEGKFTDADLLTAAGRTGQEQLTGALIFLIGCHAGGNLPSSYYGDVSDWADVFSSAGGFVGNTGFGLANNVTTALSERLLAEYADWVGTEVDGTAVSAAGALTYAKQSYLGGLGLYSGYDEKVLMEAVYYGLPMYAFSGDTQSAPLPEIPDTLTAITGTGDGLSAASLSLIPQFDLRTVTDENGEEVSFLTADGQDPLAVAGQPVLPRVVSQLGARPGDGSVPRGAFITGMMSERTDGVPAVTQPSVGVTEPSARRGGVAFPSTFATVTSQQTPTGPIDLLVVTPGRVEIPGTGNGVLERFTTMDLTVIYGPEGSESVAPLIRSVEAPQESGSVFRVVADGTGSAISRVLLLAQPQGSNQWFPYSMNAVVNTDGTTWQVDTGQRIPMRWIVQVADAAGNVATESQRGHLDPSGTTAPSIEGSTDEVALVAGDRLVRSLVVTDADAGGRLTGSFAITDLESSNSALAAGPIPVTTDEDGVTRALLDHVVAAPGSFEVVVTVCRDRECTRTAFPLEVRPANTAPTASVELSSSDAPAVWPTSTLTATAVGADAEADGVTLRYQWYINGGGLPLPDTTTSVDISPWAAPGDVVEVRVTPNDGTTDGNVARAEVTVQTPPVPPAMPTITASGRVGDADYLAGEWSTAPVTVSFSCIPGDEEIVSCTSPIEVAGDTTADGVEVTGTVRDALGNIATTTFLVRVDTTAPELAPVVSPNPVIPGQPAEAIPNASDAASGIASQQCDAPVTDVAGEFTVACRATDVAGNERTRSAAYTVAVPAPPETCLGSMDRTELAPLNADGSSVFKRSTWVPVSFRACNYLGEPITTAGFVTGVTLVSTTSLTKNPRVNEISYASTGPFAYSAARGTWVGSIPTLAAKNKVYTYRVNLSDGTSFTVTFTVS